MWNLEPEGESRAVSSGAIVDVLERRGSGISSLSEVPFESEPRLRDLVVNAFTRIGGLIVITTTIIVAGFVSEFRSICRTKEFPGPKCQTEELILDGLRITSGIIMRLRMIIQDVMASTLRTFPIS
jgi:hypothetical protein